MKKEAEWKMEEGWNGRINVEYHKSGPWTIVIDPDARDGFIRKKNQKRLVEVLIPNQKLVKGAGIPHYVVDKANELTQLPSRKTGSNTP